MVFDCIQSSFDYVLKKYLTLILEDIKLIFLCSTANGLYVT